MFDGFHSELILVDVDDILGRQRLRGELTNPGSHLVSWVGLQEGIELVHLPDVGPQVGQTRRDLEVTEESSWREFLISGFNKCWEVWATPLHPTPLHCNSLKSSYLQLECAEALASTRNQSNTLCLLLENGNPWTRDDY